MTAHDDVMPDDLTDAEAFDFDPPCAAPDGRPLVAGGVSTHVASADRDQHVTTARFWACDLHEHARHLNPGHTTGPA